MYALLRLLNSSLLLVSFSTNVFANAPTHVLTQHNDLGTKVVLPTPEQQATAFAQPIRVLVAKFASNQQISAAHSRNSKVMGGAQMLSVEQLGETVDVTEIDRMLSYLLERAGNYPPRFTDREERSLAVAELKALITQIDQDAVHPNASFDVLLRAVQLNQVGRNLDLGVSVAIKAGVYMRRAIAINPDDPQANYWYGTMLVEGGGIKEGIPYLNRAISLGYKPAYLVLAQAYLHLERREFALKALQSYHDAEPTQQEWTTAVTEKIRAGKSLIWSD